MENAGFAPAKVITEIDGDRRRTFAACRVTDADAMRAPRVTSRESARWVSATARRPLDMTGLKRMRSQSQFPVSMFLRRFFLARKLKTLILLTFAVPSVFAQSWVEQGPGPMLLGSSVLGIPGRPQSGAVNAIAVDPLDPNVIYVATVNGGIWKTTNGAAPTPFWTPLTDRKLPALSVNSLVISPVTPNSLYVGTGSTSSGGAASSGFGIAVSVDGGTTWSIRGGSTLTGKTIDSIVPPQISGGSVMVAVLSGVCGNVSCLPGVFLSIDDGISFARVSGATGSGLPDGAASSLIANPTNSSQFFVGVPASNLTSGSPGVFRSSDGGLTWLPMNTGITGLSSAQRILLSISVAQGPTPTLFAAVLDGSGLSGVFRSTDLGIQWTSMGMPSPPISQFGSFFGALAAHPSNGDVVFISGDELVPSSANGCTGETVPVFRGEASTNTWVMVVCNGANGTSPHVDSRHMRFDLQGNLLQANDGGIYRLLDPDNTLGQRHWESMNGNIRPTEFFSVAYDPLSRVIIGGSQDNGVGVQSAPNSLTWSEFLGGDGTFVAIDADQTTHPGTTIRYSSTQGLGAFNRSTYNQGNVLIQEDPILLKKASGGKITDNGVFLFQPFALNAVDPNRMLIEIGNIIYESSNKGDLFDNVGSGAGDHVTSLAYGGRYLGVPNPDVFYLGSFSGIVYRATANAPPQPLNSFPGAGKGGVIALKIDPQNYKRVFVLGFSSRVWASFDEGNTWMDLTLNLPAVNPNARAIELINLGSLTILLAGGPGGVFGLKQPGKTAGGMWAPLNGGLAHALITDLHYDYLNDVLLAGTFGRGAWTLTGAFQGGCAGAGNMC